MKKMFFLAIIIATMACMVACSNTPDTLPTFTTTTTEPVVVEPEIPSLTDNFIKTALQFIDEYPDGQDIENLALTAIQQSNGLRDSLYNYLTFHLHKKYGEEIHQFFGNSCDKVETVKVFIHNYEVGGEVGCVAFNGQEAVYNYDHNPIFLSAGVLGNTYPDNITLAEARIISYILIHMDIGDVDCCITTIEGEKSYDFSFENEDLKAIAREILLSLE